MDTNYRQSLTEILEILNHTDRQIVEKIPQKFIAFLLENMDKNYNADIDFTNDNWDNSIKEETKAILALIYRDYISTEEERKILLLEEENERIKQEQELREKYNPYNLFKNKHVELPNELKNNTQLIEVKEYPWYKRLYHQILRFFGIHP